MFLAAQLLAFGFSLPLLAQQRAQEPELTPPPTIVPKEMQYVHPPTHIPPELGGQKPPWITRWMIRPRPYGMFVFLPIIDTDPNRGTTLGILPIWIYSEPGTGRIVSIHAPSLTYNKVFEAIATYRYYYYPNSKSSVVFRTSFSTRFEREIMAEYINPEYKNTGLSVTFRPQLNVDGSNRFFGRGPAASAADEADYTEDVIHEQLDVSKPLRPGSLWRAHFNNHVQGERIYGGEFASVPDITDKFHGTASIRRQWITENQVKLIYDGRDDANTTTRGAYLEAFFGGSVNDGFFSDRTYQRHHLEGRYFYRWPSHLERTTAMRAYYEQIRGSAPFWLLPRMGGKYNLRAYGEGRFIDRGILTETMEQRFIVHRREVAGVPVELEVAPFVGYGNVFHDLGGAQIRYTRPVYGSAFRVIARPQVVGSMDFGIGQEGLAAFIDINYSF